MEKRLRKGLTSSSPEVVGWAIDELVRQGDSSAIPALMNIADGGNRRWLISHKLESQLDALAGLEQFNTPETTLYVARTLCEVVVPNFSHYVNGNQMPRWVSYEHQFTYARGQLQEALYYRDVVDMSGPHNDEILPFAVAKNEEPHKARQAILAMLVNHERMKIPVERLVAAVAPA